MRTSRSLDLTPSHETFVNRHVMLTPEAWLIAGHCLQSPSYLKCQDDFRSAFPQYKVPDKSTLFRSVARFHGTGSVGDRKLAGRPTALNDVNAENISLTLQ